MRKINLNTFGNKLRFMLWEREVSVKKLSEHVGVSAPTISMYISDSRIPYANTFKAMCDYLELTDEEILEWLRML